MRADIASALAHHRAGRLAEAETLYRRVLAADPHDIDASHFLGVIAYQRGDLPQAVHGMVGYEKYNELVRGVDIALAPFPYNGATTMMDCLWNGVLVVAMKGGETFYSRIGCSILEEAGLGRLIAEDGDDYVRIAADLAADAGARERLRASLRETMEHSRLRDFAGFTRGLEAAYREMWAAWCASRRESS